MAKAKAPGKRVQDEAKFEHAYLLFMNGIKQVEICEKVGISAPTLSAWVNDNDWRAKRAAKTITRQELINKVLQKIDSLLNTALSDDEADQKGIEDRLSKLSAMVEKLDKQANVVDAIEVFISFNTWLTSRQAIDKTITPELVKLINRTQDAFVNERLGDKRR